MTVMLAAQSVCHGIVHKAVERIGRKKVWKVVFELRQIPHPVAMPAVRETLRSLGIFIDDEDVLTLGNAFGTDNVNMDLLMAGLFSLLVPRRAYVLELMMSKLDPDSTGKIPMARLRREYDSLRHPDVVNCVREPAVISAAFMDNFEQPPDGVLTVEVLRAYYLGLSASTVKDTDFELLCVRSYSLDRPRLNFEDDAARQAGSRQASRQSRLLGQGKDHPLYTTRNAEYGSTSAQADAPSHAFGLSQKFTNNLPPRGGGATGMNM